MDCIFKSPDIEEDIRTCSNKMRYDIYSFFKDKSQYKIAEIGSHKGYTTKVLSKIFSKVYAVDNSIEWAQFNKEYNKHSTHIEYIYLDIYKDSWNILPDDYGVWSGVKQIVDELIENKTLVFETFIGIKDVPGPNGIVSNTNEGIICRINYL